MGLRNLLYVFGVDRRKEKRESKNFLKRKEETQKINLEVTMQRTKTTTAIDNLLDQLSQKGQNHV